MADYTSESLFKTRLNTIYLDIFASEFKKVDKFYLCLKAAASLFPFSCVTFLIGAVI